MKTRLPLPNETNPLSFDGQLSRRQFLWVGAALGGGLLVQVACRGRAAAEEPASGRSEPSQPSIFIRIAPDNIVFVTIPKSELGQGVRTALAAFVAEELDADWSKVRPEAASYDERLGSQGTGGSGSVLATHTRLRVAGATMRQMLVAAAAKRLGVAAAELTTKDSRVIHAASNRTLAYGDLAGDAAKMPLPPNVQLRKPADWRLLGKDGIKGVDVQDIIHGRAKYGIDVRRDGMLFASVERAQIFGATIQSFDASAALKVPGVKQVVQVKESFSDSGVHAGVAVVATNTWAAMQGRRALRINWSPGPHAQESSASYSAFMRNAVSKSGSETVNRIGDPDGVLSKATEVIRADYEFPFLSHATMEPQNCTAQFTNGVMELWSPTQFPDWAHRAVSQHLALAKDKVKVHVTPLMGGGFGRRINPDFSVEAAVIAKAVNGAPVQVVWTREDDLRHDFYRPCAVHRLEAALGADGNPVAMRHRFCTAAIDASGGGRRGDFGAGESDGIGNHVYRVPNRSTEYTLLESGVPRGWWRAVNTTHGTFAIESFIDELAEKARKDPYDYRLALIDKWVVDKPRDSREYPFEPERFKAVLTLAAEKAGWGQPLPPGHALGIAQNVPDHLTYAAEVVEASVENGKVRVHRVVVAVDCGRVYNPDGARAQLEGGVVQALSAALGEEVTIEGGAVVQGNFDRYRLLRIGGEPAQIECHWVTNDAYPVTGLGEPSVPPLFPALANAIARATGKRPRTLPIRIA
ncbi:MAG TPA: molybdopterin cofactor-binding domain-containing protein [Gemmatimonadaceae bacterium]|nr:molybdopterin cofactor-binding domain-containing protein [Gemmatimonadaceae bacterium]